MPKSGYSAVALLTPVHQQLQREVRRLSVELDRRVVATDFVRACMAVAADHPNELLAELEADRS